MKIEWMASLIVLEDAWGQGSPGMLCSIVGAD